MTGPFRPLSEAGFTDSLVPIVPPNAAMHSGFPGFNERRGKTPGIFFNGAWAPKKDWLNMPAEIERWDQWNCGAGLRARDFPGVDIDVLDAELAGQIERIVVRMLGPAPVRVGQWPKRLLTYKSTEPFTKRTLRLGPIGTVEVLGDGQQYVVAGVHPRTEKPYQWLNGHNLLNLGAKGLTAVSAAQVDALLAEIAAWAEIMGLETASAGSGASEVPANPEALYAPSLKAAADALQAVENDLDYDGWIAMGRAVKAACAGFADLGLDDGFDLWAAWSSFCSRKPGADLERCRYHWDSFHPPHRIGWHHLASLARGAGFNDAAFEFDVVELRQAPGAELGGSAPGAAAYARRIDISLDELLKQWVWVEKLEVAIEIATGVMLNRNQFNVRFSCLGNPSDSKKCAWARFIQSPFLIKYPRTTYRPGQARIIVEEDGSECVNAWRPSPIAAIPSSAGDIKPWLDHLEWLVPDSERQQVLNYLAFLVQHPERKINYALVLKSEIHGLGKDILIRPIARWLGEQNVSYLDASELHGTTTDWCANRKLVIVEEVHTFERRATMQRLKSFITAPPDRIRVNAKYVPQYEVPNIITFIMFTNQPDALSLEASDRRFFIVDCPRPAPRPEHCYAELADWYDHGGTARIVGYLQSLDIKSFNPGSHAPLTEAKTEMQQMAMPSLDAWLNDRIIEEAEPFVSDLVALSEVKAALPRIFEGVASARLAHILRRLGAHAFERVRLGKELGNVSSDRARLFAVRRADMYRSTDTEKVIELFWEQRAKAAGRGFGAA